MVFNALAHTITTTNYSGVPVTVKLQLKTKIAKDKTFSLGTQWNNSRNDTDTSNCLDNIYVWGTNGLYAEKAVHFPNECKSHSIEIQRENGQLVIYDFFKG